MSLLNILTIPDPRLREKAKEVTAIEEPIKKLAYDMVETMYANKGVGLAATQVGVPLKVIVIDVDQLDGTPNPLICINPEIIESKDRVKNEEGCLSIPGYTANVERFNEVKVRFLDLQGNEIKMTATELLSRAFQHEIDHLNGILFIDHLSRLKREMFLKKLKKSMEKSL